MGGMPDTPKAPEEKSAFRYEDDQLVESKEVVGDQIITKMITPEEERKNKERREADLVQVEGMIKDFTPELNTISPSFQRDIDTQARQMTSGANETLGAEYEKVIKSLRDNSASRFGSIQNTYYDKERDAVTKTLADQQAKVATDIEARKGQLEQQEKSQRQNYYNSLFNLSNNLRGGINEFRDLSNERYNSNMQASQMTNEYDLGVYSNQIAAHNAEVQAQAQQNAGLFGMFGGLSDIRFKDNIEETKSDLEKISNLKSYRFNYKGHKEPHIGVMAQELEKEYPELVAENDEGVKFVNYQGLIPVLLNSIKELDKKINKQEK